MRNTQGSAQEDSRRHVRASTKQRWTPSVFLTGHGNNFKEKKGRSREWLCADGGDTGVLPRDVRCDLWSEDKEPQEEIDPSGTLASRGETHGTAGRKGVRGLEEEPLWLPLAQEGGDLGRGGPRPPERRREGSLGCPL